MVILHELTDGPGYCLESLSTAELGRVRELITAQYLDRLGQLQPELVGPAKAVGIDQYHTLPIKFDHGASWPKDTRLLDPKYVAEFSRMDFFHRIQDQFGASAVISHDELNWRVVRPNRPEDVGPVHADKWFWDAGYGYGSMPAGFDRFKIWIGIYTEPGVNGLTIKPESHRSTHWKHHFEIKGGIRKPVLDEDEASLNMHLLPLKAGQMVLFHDELLHGGAVNRGTTCRVSIELTVLFDKGEGTRRMGSLLRHRAAA
jgi:hypothetical protein